MLPSDPRHGDENADNRNDQTGGLRRYFRESLGRSWATVWWLIRIMVPASATVFVLSRTGLLAVLARVLEPVMALIDLPGGAAIAVVSSVLVNLYAAIAIIPALGLDHRQLVILALLCLVAHNYLVELPVTRRTGTPVVRMIVVRTVGGLFLAWLVSQILPDVGRWAEPLMLPGSGPGTTSSLSGIEAFIRWLEGVVRLILRAASIVTLLVFVSRALQYCGIIDWVAHHLRPVMNVFGLPHSSGPAWIVANTLGLAYGAAVLREESESGRLNAADGDLLNHHLGVSHSLFEDTFLFVALGAPTLWLIAPRLTLAFLAVWERRIERRIAIPQAARP
ncbi:MAG: nucleoside recognition domain-containing protein [Spirochaetales bacterium]|nr:nucleoside recognition domain-containing protein [Spirochaetales bacterium]